MSRFPLLVGDEDHLGDERILEGGRQPAPLGLHIEMMDGEIGEGCVGHILHSNPLRSFALYWMNARARSTPRLSDDFAFNEYRYVQVKAGSVSIQ